MNQLNTEQLALLKKLLPAEAIKLHPTKKGMSTINAIHVIERLNDVFGVGAWQTGTTLLKEFSEVKTSAAGRTYTEYTCMVQTCFTVPAYAIQHCVIASSTNEDIGDAAKGATTDALTKIASWLGIGMDIWKTRDNNTAQPQTSAQPSTTATTPAQSNDLPWLKDTEVESAIMHINTGGTMADIKAKYKISRANYDKIVAGTKGAQNG
jgi:hypothetical protein